ncbi:MAG: T9SS type A sorting domain-containing protein [Bacteroidales bacterium]|nr:T9SS type A sorting domain-containing protein [Bacteroidales bacterium]
MKKTLLSLFFVVVMTVFATAQNIPDGGFENWSYQNSQGGYWDYQTDILMTLNSLYEMNGVEMSTNLTAFRITDNVHSGSYALKLTSTWFGTNAIFVPGALATLNEPVGNDYVSDFLDLGEINIKEAFAFKPWRLTGYYRYEPVNGDSASIDMKFYFGNTVTSTCEKFIIHATPEWTAFDIETGLANSYLEVDKMSMVFSASADYHFENLELCAGQAGSSLYLDDIAFRYDNSPLGLVEPLIPVVKTTIYPNPSADMVHFDFSKEVNARLVIYNISGAQIFEQNVNDNHADYNASALANGTYLYRIIEGNTILSSGRFAVAK